MQPSLLSLLLKLYITQTSLLVISAIILGDALRMLSKQFKKDSRLKVNQRTMFLHVMALFLHTFFMMFAQVNRVLLYTHPTPTMKVIWNFGRIGMYGSGIISEVIVIYLFL